LGLRLLPLAGVLLLIGIVIVTRRGLEAPIGLLVVIAATGAIGAVVIVVNGGDWMPFFRLGAPYLPLLFVLAASVLDTAVRALFKHQRMPNVAVATLCAALVLLQPGTQATHFHETLLSRNALGSLYDAVGRAFRYDARGTRRVFATPLIGRLGYFSRPAVVSDIYELTDVSVAETHERGSVFGKINLAYTGSLRPDAVEDITWPLLRQFAIQAPDRYLGLVSPSLSNFHIFVLSAQTRAQHLTLISQVDSAAIWFP
jgi:hypothetical protein